MNKSKPTSEPTFEQLKDAYLASPGFLKLNPKQQKGMARHLGLSPQGKPPIEHTPRVHKPGKSG
ncbi:MAG: hypothetical protein V4490_02325 [Pseudomonadota bacterium]